MRTVIFITIAVLCCSSAFATIAATGAACTTNPWTTTRCTTTKKYVDSAAAANAAALTGCGCTTPAGTWQAQPSVNFDSTGNSNDAVCSVSCLTDTATVGAVKQCDDTGLLCVACAANYAANGKAPSTTAMASCGCVTANSVTSCNTCQHGYYGTDASSVAVVPQDTTGGTTDTTAYLSYVGATTLPTKCVVCPTTLTNCAQCASATTCARCTTASGNTPDSNGSCSASKIIASIAFAFVGLVALLF